MRSTGFVEPRHAPDPTTIVAGRHAPVLVDGA
jgi:hypothetical protein